MNQPPNWPQQGFQPGAQPGFQSPPIGGAPMQPIGSYPMQPYGAYPGAGAPGPTSQMPGQQPNFNANPFAGLVPGEPAMTRYPYLEPISPAQPATYKLALAKVRCHRARNGKMFYIVEADITESNNPQRPVGMRCSAMIDMNNQDTWRRHVIGFLAAVYGVEPSSIVKDSPTTPWDGRTWESVATASVHDSNPLVGVPVGVVSSHIITKAGKPFTINDWRPADKLVVPPTPPAFPQQSFGGPPNFAPPPQQNFGAPPQYAPPPQQNFGAPPQYAPQQPNFAPPPQQSFGGPPNFAPPPQQSFGASPQYAPQQPQYAPPPGYPTPGYGG